jgi:hypothetical protein
MQHSRCMQTVSWCGEACLPVVLLGLAGWLVGYACIYCPQAGLETSPPEKAPGAISASLQLLLQAAATFLLAPLCIPSCCQSAPADSCPTLV